MHIRRQVGVLSAAAGDHDNRRTGERFRFVHHVVRVKGADRFRQGPVLRSHVDDRAVAAPDVLAVLQIHLRQILIGGITGSFQSARPAFVICGLEIEKTAVTLTAD